MSDFPQSIIVYRNPVEKMFWEGGYAVPMMGLVLVLFVSFLATFKVCEWVAGCQRDWMLWAAFLVSGVAGIVTFLLLF